MNGSDNHALRGWFCGNVVVASWYQHRLFVKVEAKFTVGSSSFILHGVSSDLHTPKAIGTILPYNTILETRQCYSIILISPF